MKPYIIRLDHKAVPAPDYEHRRKAILRALARLLLRVESDNLETEALPVIVADFRLESEKN